MKILDCYLGKIILQYSIITMLILLGLFTFINFLDQLSSIGKGEYNLLAAISFVILMMPRMIYELFPMAALLGTTIALAMLANDSELIVMRASGVSIMQITSSALKIASLFMITSVFVGELILPFTDIKAQNEKAEAMQQNINQQTNFWMKDADTYINIGEVLPDFTLLKVRIFEFESNKRLRSFIFARKGRFQGNYWLINDVRKTLVKDDGSANISKIDAARWESRVTPEILSVFLVKPDQLHLWQLSQYFNYLQENQQKTDVYELAFWNKIMLPLSTAVMVVLAIPFVFVNIRSGTLGQSVFVGIMLGLSFYVISKGFSYVVIAFGLSPLFGAAMPIITFLLLAIVMIRRIE